MSNGGCVVTNECRFWEFGLEKCGGFTKKKHRTQNVNVRKHFEVECALLSKNESFYRRKCKKIHHFYFQFLHI